MEKAVEIGKFRRTRSLNPAFARVRSTLSDSFDMGEDHDLSRTESSGINRLGSVSSNRSASNWEVVKGMVASEHRRTSDSRDSARTTRPSTMHTAANVVRAIQSVSHSAKERARSVKVTFSEPCHDSYMLMKTGCSDLDWSRLDSRDAVQLYESDERFSDAVQGTYNMNYHATMDSSFAKVGFKSPRVRGGTCLIEIKVKCDNLPAHKGHTAPDTKAVVKIFNLLTKKWNVEWESDLQSREASPSYRKLLRIRIPDGGNTHAIIAVIDKTRKSNSEIGRAVVNLDQVVGACEQPHLRVPAYSCFLSAPIEPPATDEDYVTMMYEAHEKAVEAPDGSCCSRVAQVDPGQFDHGFGRLILRMERLPDAALLSVSLREGVPEGLEPQTMTAGSTYVPKFQRAVFSLPLSLSLERLLTSPCRTFLSVRAR